MSLHLKYLRMYFNQLLVRVEIAKFRVYYLKNLLSL